MGLPLLASALANWELPLAGLLYPRLWRAEWPTGQAATASSAPHPSAPG